KEWAWAWPSAGRWWRPTRDGFWPWSPCPVSARRSVSPCPVDPTTMRPEPTPTPPTVYIVDDDRDMRDSLRWLMTTVGLRVEVYASAREFLDHFASKGPACLVFDVRMPGTSGLDLFEELVAKGEGTPVIFITAYADVPMAIRAMKTGAIEF